ncbi:MAG: diaminopimelate decarboxylase [Planctomycetes bacterium]|nr:diaminopimelate decarboxylase [Planctomycetota bacterium]
MAPSPRDLVARFGSPLYVYDLALVRERARALKRCITYQPFQPVFAIKANSCPAVARVMVEEGFGVDAVSPGEVAIALKLGVKPDLVIYTENNMTDGEMAEAMAQGVLINCGSLDRLERLGKAGARACAVRFNPDIGDGSNEKICTGGPMSKFGVHFTQVAEVLRIERETGIQVVGCHMHIGSGFLDATAFVKAMGVLLDVARQLPHLRFVDFGGGIGIPYRPDEQPMDLDALGQKASALMAGFADRYTGIHGRERTVELHLEPGRFLVAESGTLITTVTSVKTNPDSKDGARTVKGRTYVGCDTGFNHLVRPTMYGAYHRIDNLTSGGAPLTTVDVVGNICESGDVFARDRALPMPKLGDLLALRDAGAYGMTMASAYNTRPLPAEVVIDGDDVRLARPRQTIAQLLEQYIW